MPREEQIPQMVKEHLAMMEKDRDRIIDQCFPEDSVECDEFEDFSDKYLRGLEKALENPCPRRGREGVSFGGNRQWGGCGGFGGRGFF